MLYVELAIAILLTLLFVQNSRRACTENLV